MQYSGVVQPYHFVLLLTLPVLPQKMNKSSQLDTGRGGWKAVYRTYALLLLLPLLSSALQPFLQFATAASQIYLPITMRQAESHPPPPAATALWSAPIAVSPSDGSVWVVNPDANSVTAVDGRHFAKLDEIATGQEPWSIAITPDGSRILVANRAGGTLTMIDAAQRKVVKTIVVGAEPGALLLTPSGTLAFVTLMAEQLVAIVEIPSGKIVERIAVGPAPYALAFPPDGERAYITHLIAQPRPQGAEASDDGHQGLVTVLNVAQRRVERIIELAPNAFGFPNRLASITLAGERAWLAHLRAAPALPTGLTTTVFAAVLSLDLAEQSEDTAAFLPLNDQEIFGSPVNNPAMAVPSRDGKQLYVVLSGSNLLEVVDVAAPHQPELVKFLAVGDNPQGIALNQEGTLGYVMNYLARSVTVIDLAKLETIATIATTAETLQPEMLRGKILFNSAADPRLTQGSWISCASCHFEGWPDGVTWIFPDGVRQTPMLWNAGETLPWHWSAALDEAQDVEDTIHVIQRGLGLGPGADPPLLGATNAGRSPDLDALALFLKSGLRAPRQPIAETAAGRTLFISAGCAACHSGPHWTISSLPGAATMLDLDGNGMVDELLRDVGTAGPLDGRGATGFDVPSLVGVGLTNPYLHDGSMPTLEALLASGHPDPLGNGNHFTVQEIAELVSFLQSISAETPPVPVD